MVWKHGAVGYDALVPLCGALPHVTVVFEQHKTTKAFHNTSKMTSNLNTINRGLQIKHHT
jgi:hypothetical protein